MHEMLGHYRISAGFNHLAQLKAQRFQTQLRADSQACAGLRLDDVQMVVVHVLEQHRRDIITPLAGQYRKLHRSFQPRLLGLGVDRLP